MSQNKARKLANLLGSFTRYRGLTTLGLWSVAFASWFFVAGLILLVFSSWEISTTLLLISVLLLLFGILTFCRAIFIQILKVKKVVQAQTNQLSDVVGTLGILDLAFDGLEESVKDQIGKAALPLDAGKLALTSELQSSPVQLFLSGLRSMKKGTLVIGTSSSLQLLDDWKFDEVVGTFKLHDVSLIETPKLLDIAKYESIVIFPPMGKYSEVYPSIPFSWISETANITTIPGICDLDKFIEEINCGVPVKVVYGNSAGSHLDLAILRGLED